jgi:hypothetical protein
LGAVAVVVAASSRPPMTGCWLQDSEQLVVAPARCIDAAGVGGEAGGAEADGTVDDFGAVGQVSAPETWRC